MKKYEYKVEENIWSSLIETTLNEMAKDGWRCISVAPGEGEDEYILIFERLCEK